MHTKIELPKIPLEELTPTVKALLYVISQCIAIIDAQAKEIQELKDEIARLKGNKPRPKISPSKMDSDINRRGKKRKSNKKRPGSMKGNKTKNLKPDEIETIHPENIPEGSRFIGYTDYFEQDIIFKAHVKNYRRARWQTPSGEWLIGKLPDHVRGHFGYGLKRYILYLNYGLNVPQNLIHESLLDIGLDISKGTINDILIKDKHLFHEEKELLLTTGLELSSYVVTDDTGARHAGRNGYCNHIGNEYFAYFQSTYSKSRINFLQILRGKHKDYLLNSDAFDYMVLNGLAESKLKRFEGACESNRKFDNEEEWNEFLKMVGIRKESHIRIVTEAALVASILSHDFNKDMVILSDEAGQFDVFLHALCWIHAERKIDRLIPVNDYDKNIIEDIQGQMWQLYDELKSYKNNPCEIDKIKISEQFDKIFTHKTEFKMINKALQAILNIKKGLLLVLERPEIPLNNNISENDIRVFATKRKIHGGTRSEDGRQCRDTFMSLKKTCRKLGISFFEYLYDRIAGIKNIPLLSEIIKQKLPEGI